MKKIQLVLIVLCIAVTSHGQNIISNNWNVRLNGFKFAVTSGSSVAGATDTALTVYNDKTVKLGGKFFGYKDSIPLSASIGACQISLFDSSNNQYKRINLSNLGFTSIYNSDGTAVNRTVTVSGYLKLNGLNTAASPIYFLTKQTDSSLSEMSIANASSLLAPSPLVFVDTSTTTVTNTTSETSLLGTGIGNNSTITGITAGSIITIKGTGTVSTDATAGIPTINFNLANITVGASLLGLNNNLTNAYYSWECRFIVPTVGNAKNLIVTYVIRVDNGGTEKVFASNYTTSTLDITANSTYALTASWDVASLNNSITSLFNTVEITRK